MSNHYSEVNGVWVVAFPEQHKNLPPYSNTLRAMRRQKQSHLMSNNKCKNNNMWIFTSENDTDIEDFIL